MARTWISHTRTIYCTKRVDTYFTFGSYKPLKEVEGIISYGRFSHTKQAIEVPEETCDELINQCMTEFGNDFQYIQSGQAYVPWWDAVKANGEICQHLYASEHPEHEM